MSTRHSFLSTTGLLRSNSSVSVASSYHASTRDTMRGPTTVSSPAPTPTPDPQAPGPNSAKKLATRAGVLPLGSTFIVILAGFFSLLFIVCISFAFMGLEDGSEFKDTLNDLARNSPGIVLVGDNVDVDVDEPAVTVRWSILGCGSDFMLPQSGGIHGSDLCGTPVMALQIFVDGDDEPTATYDPQRMPFASDSGQRRSIQNLYQFDSDHVLDVHEARLYPFDEYHLTSTIRAISIATNQTVPIVRLPTITQTSSFIITPTDMASYVTMNATDGQQQQQSSRDLDLIIRRPGEARAFALLLFAASWMMTHAAMAYIILSFKADATKRIVHYMGFVLAAILLIPQMRNAMPDAPGFDGKSHITA
ncbi:hypothetical protein C8Q75DRAFT_720174 [Abortiporus biennis]|nr:hypothetical protein C8Q75DRAFT_720174 [Abortiporus biennis]